jgi:hypothetical protein
MLSDQMTDPRNIRGARSPTLARPQWIWAGIGFLAGVLVLVGAIWGQLRNDSAGVQLTLKNMDDRVGRIEQTLNDITSNGRLARTDPALQTPGPNRAPSESISKFYLKENEADVIRQVLQAPRKSAGTDGRYRVGQLLVGLAVKQIPDDLVGKVPQLKGLLYTFDPANHAIAIIDPRSNRVISLI